MKSIILILLTLIIEFHCDAQDTTKHKAFLYLGTNYVPNSQLSYSIEFGSWGISSNTSFSLTYDLVVFKNKISSFIGSKAYYTVHSEKNLCYMIYIAPKFDIHENDKNLLEFGFNANYTLSKSLLLGITLGNQYTSYLPINMFTSIGFVYLFTKNKI